MSRSVAPAATASASPATAGSRAGPGGLWTLLFSLAVALLLGYGWARRGESYLSPEEGAGYALGIIGGSAMLVLMLYPARKQWRFMRSWGPVKLWFEAHMLLGVLGPVLILFHANFTLGSANGTLALASMLLVAGSGVIGRYCYSRIHIGLHGKRTSLAELRERLQLDKGRLTERFRISGDVAARLRRYESRLLRDRPFLLGLLLLPLVPLYGGWTRSRVRRRLRRGLRRQVGERGWRPEVLPRLQADADAVLRSYIEGVRQASELALYDRLFGLWRVLHLPLFVVMVVTGVVHVVAVHLY